MLKSITSWSKHFFNQNSRPRNKEISTFWWVVSLISCLPIEWEGFQRSPARRWYMVNYWIPCQNVITCKFQDWLIWGIKNVCPSKVIYMIDTAQCQLLVSILIQPHWFRGHSLGTLGQSGYYGVEFSKRSCVQKRNVPSICLWQWRVKHLRQNCLPDSRNFVLVCPWVSGRGECSICCRTTFPTRVYFYKSRAPHGASATGCSVINHFSAFYLA